MKGSHGKVTLVLMERLVSAMQENEDIYVSEIKLI